MPPVPIAVWNIGLSTLLTDVFYERLHSGYVNGLVSHYHYHGSLSLLTHNLLWGELQFLYLLTPQPNTLTLKNRSIIWTALRSGTDHNYKVSVSVFGPSGSGIL
jgi:hypothetical protein